MFIYVLKSTVCADTVILQGFCDVTKNGFLSDENSAKCMDKTLSLDAITHDNIASNPTVPFGFIQVCYVGIYLHSLVLLL